MRETERGSRREEWRETEKGGWEFSPRRNPRPVRKSPRVRAPTREYRTHSWSGAYPHPSYPYKYPYDSCHDTILVFFVFDASHTTGTTRHTYATLSPVRSASGPSAARASSYPSASRNLLLTVTTIAPTRRCGRSREDTNSVPSFLSPPDRIVVQRRAHLENLLRGELRGEEEDERRALERRREVGVVVHVAANERQRRLSQRVGQARDASVVEDAVVGEGERHLIGDGVKDGEVLQADASLPRAEHRREHRDLSAAAADVDERTVDDRAAVDVTLLEGSEFGFEGLYERDEETRVELAVHELGVLVVVGDAGVGGEGVRLGHHALVVDGVVHVGDPLARDVAAHGRLGGHEGSVGRGGGGVIARGRARGGC